MQPTRSILISSGRLRSRLKYWRAFAFMSILIASYRRRHAVQEKYHRNLYRWAGTFVQVKCNVVLHHTGSVFLCSSVVGPSRYDVALEASETSAHNHSPNTQTGSTASGLSLLARETVAEPYPHSAVFQFGVLLVPTIKKQLVRRLRLTLHPRLM